jgi:hypothetical protein
VVQLNALDLIIVAPELEAFRDVLQRLEEIGGRAEIVLDRRLGERRRSESSTVREEHRQAERRALDVTEPIRGGAWVLIRADQRPPASDADRPQSAPRAPRHRPRLPPAPPQTSAP